MRKRQRELWDRRTKCFHIEEGRFLFLVCFNLFSFIPCQLWTTLVELNRFIRFWQKDFLGHNIGMKGKHWVVWETLSLPKSKEGSRFRSLHDIADAPFNKNWSGYLKYAQTFCGANLYRMSTAKCGIQLYIMVMEHHICGEK